MLVLTRKKDQAISIGDGIEITVLEIKGDQVKLGINAPREVPVYRKELYQEIIKENREAVEKPALNLEAIAELIKNEIKSAPGEE